MRTRRDMAPSAYGVLPALLAALLICGCARKASVSPTGGKAAPATVERPALDNDELATWRRYYASQFRVYADNALEPAEFYPESAREAHVLERQVWSAERLAANQQQRRRENLYARVWFVLLGIAGYGAYALVRRS